MFEDVISEFKDYLHNVKKASANTIVSYQRDLRKYFNYLNDNGVYSCRDIRSSDIDAYVNYLRKNGFSDSTVSRNIASIKSLHKFLVDRDLISEEITVEVKAPKVIKKTPDILTVDEVDKLLSQPSGNKPKHLRDKAMLELMYATGIRVSELITLKKSDVNIKSSYIVCKDGEKQRTIPFGRKAKEALVKYLESGRSKFVSDGNMHLLFTNYSGTEMSRQGFWKLIKSYAAKAQIEAEITPHTLRHSFAAHMIENGADVHMVSELLGHSDISLTKIYVSMKNDRIRNIYKKAHPRN